MDRANALLPNANEGSKTSQLDTPSVHSEGKWSQRSSVFNDPNAEFEKSQKYSPFNMRWIHGYNHKAGVLNLNAHGSTVAFYAASNCGVLFNWTTHQMQILQGHKHMVKCIAKDREGNWLVTADSGADNILIVWNRKSLYPERTLFSPHGVNKIVKVAMSADAKHLLTLGSNTEKVETYDLYWWIWSYGEDMPHAKLNLPLARDHIAELVFNPIMSDQFLLLTRHSIWIGISSKVVSMEHGVPKETDLYEMKVNKVNLNVNIEEMHERLMCQTFVENTSQILVATSRGTIMVLGYTMEYNENILHSAADYEDIKLIKEIKLEKWRINVIKSIDNVIITGNSHGEMHFYDDQLKLMYWLHGMPIDGVKTLSFNITRRSYQIFDTKCKKACLCWEKAVAVTDPVTGKPSQKLLLSKIPSDATTSGKPFIVRDFIISTINQGVVFMDFVGENYETIVDNRVSPVISITVHPAKPFTCMGFADGTVMLYNFLQHQPIVRLNLREHFTVVIPAKEDSINFNIEVEVPELSVTCVQYSPSGLHLICGLNTGELIMLDPSTLDLVKTKPYKDTMYAIKQICFSVDSLMMATADDGKTVCVYNYNCETYEWDFVGKHRAHYKDITKVMFLPKKNVGGDFKLISIGKDRIMVEYDIAASSDEYLEILSLDRIEQTAVPLTAIAWPTPKGLDPEVYRTDLPLILVATDEFKFKIMNYGTTMTLSTTLGPRYETAVCKMQLVTDKKQGDEELQYLAFTTRDVIGLQKLPLDGNPYKHVGMLAHPTKIIGMCFREDLGIMFTIGEKDTSMIQWAANYRAVEASTKAGGVELDPYYCLIEDMRPGWLFQEIRDLFYYIQILCQGTFSPAIRRVKDYIPIDSLPDLMRALGFFPSEYAVENLLVEAKYKVYLRSPVDEIDFEEFVKLYLNHRPAFGESFKRIRIAFKNFADIAKDTYMISREDFIEILTANGECFSIELTWYLLSILAGHSFEDRANMTEGDFSFLPEKISLSDLVNDIIGMQEMEDISDTYSHIGSYASLGSRTTCESEASEDRFGKAFW